MSPAVRSKLFGADLNASRHHDGRGFDLRRSRELVFMVTADGIKLMANRPPTVAERIAAGFVFLEMTETEDGR